MMARHLLFVVAAIRFSVRDALTRILDDAGPLLDRARRECTDAGDWRGAKLERQIGSGGT
jgi:hypothetical protein